MKFCDKLQKLRKENNITQELLADKLNVSRQAVSKWESGTAYPDTEKLIQISKIFNVSLDELINDNKTTKEENKKIKKIDFVEIFNLVFEFISKTVSMFWSMKFSQKIKFLFEMAILVLVIFLSAHITTTVICELIRRIFIFLPGSLVRSIIYLIDTLLYIVWIVLGGIIFIKVLKTRYLDYYIIINDKNVTERVIEEPIKELKEQKDYKIVIRDPDTSSLNILKKISKLFIFCLKILSIFILIPAIFGFISFMICLVISLTYITFGLFFNGITIALIGTLLFTYLVIEFIMKLIFNRKLNYKIMFIIFITSISLIGIGIGTSITSFKDFEIIDTESSKEKIVTKTIEMSDNLVISNLLDIKEENIIIDNSLKDIKLDILTNESNNIEAYTYSTYTSESNAFYNILSIHVNNYNNDYKEFKKVLDDFKNKKIKDYYHYDYSYQIVKLYISSDNLTKIKENYQKCYQ